MIKIAAIIISLAALGMVLYLIFSKNQKPWNEMTEREQMKKKSLVAGGLAIFITGLLAAFFLGKKK